MKYLKLTCRILELKKNTIMLYSYVDDNYYIIKKELFEINKINGYQENTINIGIPKSHVTRKIKIKRLLK